MLPKNLGFLPKNGKKLPFIEIRKKMTFLEAGSEKSIGRVKYRRKIDRYGLENIKKGYSDLTQNTPVKGVVKILLQQLNSLAILGKYPLFLY